MTIDKSLIIRLQQQDRDAFKVIYTTCLPFLYGFVQKMVKSPELTEDICHDVFIKLWDNAGRLDPDRPLQPFLFEIAKNHLLVLIKRSNMEKGIIEEIMKHAERAVNSTENIYQFTETSAILASAIQQLPPQRKRIFQLCKQEDLSYSQAAARLRLSESTINSQMVKALKFVKNHLNTLFFL
jgi:RNA polymerase sigma-70 factor (ECF subfamily)